MAEPFSLLPLREEFYRPIRPLKDSLEELKREYEAMKSARGPTAAKSSEKLNLGDKLTRLSRELSAREKTVTEAYEAVSKLVVAIITSTPAPSFVVQTNCPGWDSKFNWSEALPMLNQTLGQIGYKVVEPPKAEYWDYHGNGSGCVVRWNIEIHRASVTSHRTSSLFTTLYGQH